MEQFRDLAPGDHRLPCPECGKGPRDKALSVSVKQDGGVWHCFRCSWAGGWAEARFDSHPGRPIPAKPAPERHLTLAANWRAFWDDLDPIRAAGLAYLKARECAIPPKDGHLRFAAELRHPSGYVGPALVALVTDAVTCEPMTLHRTWIQANGEKANIETPRLLLGRHRKDGGVIRLWPDEAVTQGLAIAEGIETALTVALAYRPVFAALDAGNLGKFPVLEGVESLLIAADNDPAGERETEKCAERWYRAGREVRIARSPVPGQDLNDLARAA